MSNYLIFNYLIKFWQAHCLKFEIYYMKNEKEKKLGFFGKLKQVLTDERTQFCIGIVLIFFALYVVLAMASFFVSGADDWSVVQNYQNEKSKVEQLRESGADVTAAEKKLKELHSSTKNWTGYGGAVLSEALINRSFGIGTFALVWFVVMVALRLMRVKVMPLWKAFLAASFITVWLSLTLDFCLGTLLQKHYVLVGGAHGRFLDSFLVANLGFTGTLLLIIGTGLVFAVLAFSSTIPALRRIFHPQKDEAEVETEPETNPAETVPEAVAPEDAGDGELPGVEIVTNTDTPEDLPFEIVRDPKEDEETPENGEKNVAADANEEPKTTIETVDTSANDDTVSENYDPLKELGPYDPQKGWDYNYPTLDLLKDYGTQTETVSAEEQRENQQNIIRTLQNFGIGIKKIIETIGPTVTLYEIVPEDGVRISKIRNLEADIMLALSAKAIRIIAPIPGKGTIGIEMPNLHPRTVSMRATIASKKFQESNFELPVALGRTITNDIFMFDLTKMPHLLVAGATGQGKSVGMNAIITSLLYKKHPSQLKFVLVDPKKVEFSIYSDIEKHFLAELPDAEEPVITDVDKVKQTLNSICKEMDQRYDLLKLAHVRNIKEYNEKFVNRQLNPQNGHRYMPYIVVVIDEFGDLIMTAGKEVEMPIARIAQLARAIGIHMVIATQRPSVNIITGMIKANFPARIAFKVSARVDSQTILDAPGAQQLVGKGDLLFSQGGTEMTRVQCAFVDTPEVERIVKFIADQEAPIIINSANNRSEVPYVLPEADLPEADGGDGAVVDMRKLDSLFNDAAHWVVGAQQGSTSMLQRKFEIGFNRAGRIMDQLEAAGIVGPASGSKPRQVLVHTEYELGELLKTIL